VVGSRDDYDEWARLVDDDSFGWENLRRCLDKIETLHAEIPNPALKKYVNPDLEGMAFCVHHQVLKIISESEE
jgi:hypothetical protein